MKSGAKIKTTPKGSRMPLKTIDLFVNPNLGHPFNPSAAPDFHGQRAKYSFGFIVQLGWNGRAVDGLSDGFGWPVPIFGHFF